MIRSMTGFGRAECDENGIKVTVEIQSVNGRFLDLKTKLPRFLNEYEDELRKICRKYINRGRVFLSIYIDQPDARLNNLKVDFDLANRYVKLAEEMAVRYDIDNRLDARSLLTLPDVLKFDENNSDNENIWEIANSSVIKAFETHKTMREKEGTAMGSDISNRLNTVKGYIEDIEKGRLKSLKQIPPNFVKKLSY